MVAFTLFVLVQYLFLVHRLFRSFQFFLSSSSKVFIVMNINYLVASHVPYQFFIIFYFSITVSHLFKRSHFSKKGVHTILIEYQTWFNVWKNCFYFWAHSLASFNHIIGLYVFIFKIIRERSIYIEIFVLPLPGSPLFLCRNGTNNV